MTYQELIDNIKSLGFADDTDITEFVESGVLYDSINMAIRKINAKVAPIYKTYEFSVDGDETGYMYIVMPDIDEYFLEFKNVPVLYSVSEAYKDSSGNKKWEDTDVYKKFNDYEIESDDTLVIDLDTVNDGIADSEDSEYDDVTQTFKVFYRADHETFTGTSTQLASELPLQRKVHMLVPLLASYYTWLDDEPTKAAQYYNMYEQEAEELKAGFENNKMKIRVLPGGM